jgi:hypothetical protein
MGDMDPTYAGQQSFNQYSNQQPSQMQLGFQGHPQPSNWGYNPRPPRQFHPRNDYQGFRPSSFAVPSASGFLDRDDLNYVKRARYKEAMAVETAITQSLTGSLGPATAAFVAQSISDPSSRSGSSALLTALTLGASANQQKPPEPNPVNPQAIAQQVVQHILPLLPSQQLAQPFATQPYAGMPQPAAFAPVMHPPHFYAPYPAAPTAATHQPPYIPPPPPVTGTHPPYYYHTPATPAPAPTPPYTPPASTLPPPPPFTAAAAAAGPSNAAGGATGVAPQINLVLPRFAEEQDRFKSLDPTLKASIKQFLTDQADPGELNSKMQTLSSDDVKSLYAAVCDPATHPAFTTKAAGVYWISILLWQHRTAFIQAA